MTMSEKILARASGRQQVAPGDLVLAKVDFAMGHDLTIPPSGKIMREQMGADHITKGDQYHAEPFPQFMADLMKMGGLVPWVRKRLEERRAGRL